MLEVSPFKILVIHHSHTDIGYTAYQHQIERYQIDFIRQALSIIKDEQIKSGSQLFKWNCETFWAVEKFLEKAKKSEINKFKQAVRDGFIGLSGNYLNLNELLDYDILKNMLARAASFGQAINKPVDSAMTADINGFGWGFAQALYDNGIDNLFTCIHTHHGMFPLKRFLPFWWETPHGDKILVFNGEHYHYGNELGIVPNAVSSYLTKDECDAEMIYTDHWGVAEIRIPRFVSHLKKESYPYKFVPVMASGLRTDNAPPSRHIVDFIERWNEKHGENIELQMVTLGEFFALLRSQKENIATYRGDWPDWWSDGQAASPSHTKIFRAAQRDYNYYRTLKERYPKLPKKDLAPLEYDLTLYAEHTFSHSDAMSRPGHELVHGISARKKAFAVSAAEKAGVLLDDAFERLGAVPLATDTPLLYRVINPFKQKVSGPVGLTVGHYEYHELKLDKGIEVCCKDDTAVLPFQIENVPLGASYIVYIELEPGEEKLLEINRAQKKRLKLADERNPEDIDTLESPFVAIRWEKKRGIVSWIDSATRRVLVRPDRIHAPFTPVYEMTPVRNTADICAVRSKMGLNRKGADVQRSIGRLDGVESYVSGDVFSCVTLKYSAEGLNHYTVELKAYNDAPRVDITVRLHKDSRWEPENVYLSLPFTTGEQTETLWLDKAGAPVRPRIDQIPGTLIDFYSLQEGLAYISANFGAALAVPDHSLVQLGDINHQKRKLHAPDNSKPDASHLYAWLMTNYWETNFDADLGGFYEFRYILTWGAGLNNVETALQTCRNINHGIKSFRTEK